MHGNAVNGSIYRLNAFWHKATTVCAYTAVQNLQMFLSVYVRQCFVFHNPSLEGFFMCIVSSDQLEVF